MEAGTDIGKTVAYILVAMPVVRADRAALASREPFCFDTLTLPQWLQFVFIPRMYALLESGQDLPETCGIAPLAEEYFRGSVLFVRPLLTHLASLDSYINHSSSRDV